jgi:hypothetical protein
VTGIVALPTALSLHHKTQAHPPLLPASLSTLNLTLGLCAWLGQRGPTAPTELSTGAVSTFSWARCGSTEPQLQGSWVGLPQPCLSLGPSGIRTQDEDLKGGEKNQATMPCSWGQSWLGAL